MSGCCRFGDVSCAFVLAMALGRAHAILFCSACCLGEYIGALASWSACTSLYRYCQALVPIGVRLRRGAGCNSDEQNGTGQGAGERP